MSEGTTIRRRVVFRWARRRRVLRTIEEASVAEGRVPHVARFLALAIRLEDLVRRGHAPDYATVARLGRVSRARMTQLLNLTLLAPDIQEAILFLPPVRRGRDPITERDLRPIVAEPNWQSQRRMWAKLIRQVKSPAGAMPSGLGDTSTTRR